MTNLSSFLKGTIYILVCAVCLSLQSYSGHSPKVKHSTQHEFIPGTTHDLTAGLTFAYSVAMVPSQYIPEELGFIYLAPVNDSKPDNTNVQLWRNKSLIVFKAERNC